MIVDGGKGLRAAGRKAFRQQRCQWHKRENVVSYLEQPVERGYDEVAALQSLQHELEDRNQSAAGSLAEGPTLNRLGVYGVLGRS